MSNDIPEKGAIVQRDKETYAIAPHIPGGIMDVRMLRKIADVAEKYNASAVKITSAQRIALVGLRAEDLDSVWTDLGMSPGAAIGLCVRSIKICPGTTFCKRGQQDAVGVGLKLDTLYHGMELPAKLKMGVSGCQNTCAESSVKDIGLIGTIKGWKLLVGGSSGIKPRIADVISEGLTDDEALNLVQRIIEFMKSRSEQKRLGRVIDDMGLEEFRSAIL